MRTILIIIVVAILSFTLGYLARGQHGQNANDLLSVGFTITDPEGFPVERFDE